WPPTPASYPPSLHDALPILAVSWRASCLMRRAHTSLACLLHVRVMPPWPLRTCTVTPMLFVTRPWLHCLSNGLLPGLHSLSCHSAVMLTSTSTWHAWTESWSTFAQEIATRSTMHGAFRPLMREYRFSTGRGWQASTRHPTQASFPSIPDVPYSAYHQSVFFASRIVTLPPSRSREAARAAIQPKTTRHWHVTCATATRIARKT